ncbi:MAG: insulinase family protein [Acidobacteriota bacterium]
MKRVGISLIIFLILINFCMVEGKGKKIDKLKFPELRKIEKPEIERTITKNGIKIRLIRDDKFPVINFSALFRGGDVYSPGTKVGLAPLTAQLMRIGGAGSFSGEEIDLKLDSGGISISVVSGMDYFSVNLTSLKENFDEAISILADILMNPAFNKDKFKEIKGQMSSTISRRNDDPSSILRREFDKLIYGKNSPFSASMEYDYLDNIEISDVKAFYNAFFKPSRMLAGVTGPISKEKIKSVLEKYLGKWSGKPVSPRYPTVGKTKYSFKIGFAEKSNMNQSQISIGHLGVKENIDEKAKILIFNSIFSQGFNSRLMQRLRVKMGLTYGVGGGIISQYLYPGKVYFSTFTKSESTIDAVKAIFDEIDKIRKEKVTAQELEDAKDYFLNSYVFKFSSPEKILNTYLVREFFGLDAAKYDKLIDDIKKVTADDVYKVANKYLEPEKMMVLIVGSKKKIKGKLSDIGKVGDIDIAIKPPKMKEVIPEATPESLQKGKKIVFASLKKNYSGYRNIKSSKRSSDMNLVVQGRALSLSTETTMVYPDKVYNETNVMGMKIIRVVNGNKGILQQMGQKKIIAKEEIEKNKFGDIYDIFHSKGKYNFQFLGEKKIDNKMFDLIYVSDKNSNWTKFYINKKSGLIEIKEKIENIAGRKGIAKMISSDFKVFNGIAVPGKTKVFIKSDKLMDITLKDFKVNLKVDRSIFKIDK